MIAQTTTQRLRDLADPSEWEVSVWLTPGGFTPNGIDFGGVARADRVEVAGDGHGLGGGCLVLTDDDGEIVLIPESQIRRVTIQRAGA